MPITERRAFLDFEGRRADGHLVKSIVPQFDGSPHAGDNCACAGEAHRCLVNMHGQRPGFGSPWPPTGASIRRGTGDTSGGTSPYQTTGVSLAEYHIPRDIRIVSLDDVDEWLWKGGSLNILVRYAAISNAGYSGSPGFMGSHTDPAAGIRDLSPERPSNLNIQYLMCDTLYDGRRSGIPEGPHWISRTVMARAAGDLDLGGGLSVRERYGAGRAMVSFGTRIWTPPPPTTPVRLRFGAKRLAKPRIYTPKYRGSWLRKSPRVNNTNRIGRWNPGDRFHAFQSVKVAGKVWVGNKDGTAWMMLAGLKFVRYL